MTTPNPTEQSSDPSFDPSVPTEKTILETLLYTRKGNALLAMGGMYTVSMGVGFTLLYILVALPIALGIIGIYTAFLFMYIWIRAPTKKTRKISYVLFIGIPYVVTAVGIIGYGLFS